MKKTVLFWLLLLTFQPFFAQNLHHKPNRLQALTIDEINTIFNQKNEVLKWQDLTELLEETCKNLNGAAFISLDKRILVKENVGYKRLFGHKKGFEQWTKFQLDSARALPNNLIDSTTAFELASVSKQFTAVSILKLVEQGKLRLTDSLTTFFPELPYKNITIHHLLTHTSGLPEYIKFPDDYFADTSQLLTNEEVVQVMATQKPPIQFEPAADFKYTNTNYMLLALIIEKVSGVAYEDFVRRTIFIPAGMKNSYFVTEIGNFDTSAVTRGHLRNREMLPFYYMNGTLGDKGIYSTIDDMCRWKKFFFDDRKILSSKMFRMATTRQNVLRGRRKAAEAYGYGFRLENDDKKDKLIYHGGLWQGFQNLFIYRPKDKTFILFLSNFRNGAHYGKSKEIFHIIDGA